MKVAQFSLPLSAMLVIGLTQNALAGPQSLLDPYASVKAPTRKPAAKKAAATARPAAPTSVLINGPDLPPLKKEKKEKPLAIKQESSPEPIVTKSAAPSEKNSKASSTEGGGFFAGTKEIFHGFSTAAKGAVVAPTRAVASGAHKMAEGTKSIGGKVADGTKNVGSKMADGTKSSGGIFVKGAKSVGNGFKAMGGKIKDGTMAVGSVIPGVGKKDDAPKAVANKPLPPLEGAKKPSAPEKIIAEKPEKIGAEKPVKTPEKAKVDAGGDSLGGKVLAMPKTAAHGVVSAAAKTGEVTKKMATAPLGLFGKLNPFHKKEQAPAVAGKETKPAQ